MIYLTLDHVYCRLYDLHQAIYEKELKAISAINDDEQNKKRGITTN